MKIKFLFTFALLLCPLSVFAAGGTCPSGTYTVRTVSGTLTALGVTNGCYFVSSATGTDTNAGTTEGSPWAHAPGMQGCSNNCSSATISAGTGIILKGGDTWGASSLGWLWTHSGTSSHPNYVGVDPTWFNSGCGASWCRPILNPAGSSMTGSYYTFLNNGATAIYTTFDNIEETGWSCAAMETGNMNATISPDGEYENFYIHGWSYTGGDSSCQISAFSANISDGNSQVAGFMVDNNVVDGSDQSPSPVASPSTTDSPVEILHGDMLFNNVFRYIYDINGDFNQISGNWIDNVLTGNSGDHCNMTNMQSILTGSVGYAYNNRYTNMECSGGLILWLSGNTASSSAVYYAFGNVIYSVDSGSTQLITTCTHPASGPNCGNFYVFNNTAEGANGQQLTGNGETSPRGVVTMANNHMIGNLTLCENLGVTCTDDGNELIQTAAVANANTSTAYNQYNASTTYAYSPQASTNSTVHAGQNACTGLSLTCTGTLAAALSDTTYATENTSNHTVVMRTANARGSTWDIGAYQYISGALTGGAAYTGTVVFSGTSAGQIP